MNSSIRHAIAALTSGADAQRHFDLAADRIARALLDIRIPHHPLLEIGVRAEPSRLVGGDYIDLFSSPAGIVFGLGDASGKSLAAALNALMLRYLVRGLVTALGTSDLAQLVTHANTVVSHDVDGDSFITFVCGEVAPAMGRLRLVNAGHEPALILRATSDTAEVTPPDGIVLGVASAATFRQVEISVGPGDLIILYTDGLTEATNERGELYTIERLQATIVEHRALPAPDLANRVFETVRAHSHGELRDDSTILVFRILK